MFPLRGNIGVDGRISGFLRECPCSTLWKAVVEKELSILNAPGTVSYTGQSFSKRAVAGVKDGSQRLGGPSFAGDNHFSKLGPVVVCREKRSFKALGPRAAFERSGRRPQAGGIHSRRQAQRASCKSRVRTVCPELTGNGVTRTGGGRQGESAFKSPAFFTRWCFRSRRSRSGSCPSRWSR